MKLYNLFNEIIFEETHKHKQLLTESVSDDDVIKAIDGKYNVNIMYQDEGETIPSKRYIQVYVLGNTLAGNRVIRAYQIQGGSRTEPQGWKFFLTDRVSQWNTTNMKWQNPISDYDNSIESYNQVGDKSMSSVIHQVKPSTFTRQRSDISQKPEINNNDELNK